MKISIITVVYNNEIKIKNTIESVLSQKNIDLEYIIIDGGSRDNTLQIINQYSDKISIIVSEHDNGIYDAMNKGLNYATGEIIGLLNSDDIYFDEFVLEKVCSAFEGDSSLDLIYGNLLYVDFNNTDKIIRKWRSSSIVDNFFELANVPPHPSTFVRKNVYEIMGNYNEKYFTASDYDFLFRALNIFKFKSYFLDSYLVRMSAGGASNSSFRNIIKQNLAILNIWKDNNKSMPFYFFPVKIFKKLKQYFI